MFYILAKCMVPFFFMVSVFFMAKKIDWRQPEFHPSLVPGGAVSVPAADDVFLWPQRGKDVVVSSHRPAAVWSQDLCGLRSPDQRGTLWQYAGSEVSWPLFFNIVNLFNNEEDMEIFNWACNELLVFHAGYALRMREQKTDGASSLLSV